MSRAESRKASNSGSLSVAFCALVDEAVLDIAQRLLQLRVAERARGVLLEIAARCCERSSDAASFGIADRRLIGHPGENFRDVAHLDGLPSRREFARHVEQASEIAGKQRRRAGVGHVARFRLDDRA